MLGDRGGGDEFGGEKISELNEWLTIANNCVVLFRHTWFDRYVPLHSFILPNTSSSLPFNSTSLPFTNPWFRDLTVAGRVLVKDGDKFDSKLVRVDR